MTPKVNIRPASEEDVKCIVEIERQCFTDPWSEKLFLEALKTDSIEIYSAVENSEITGFLVLSTGYDDMNVDNIAVSHAHRRKGIAKALLSFAHEKYENRPFLLEVRESNEPAINLYKTLGYERVGYRRRYYRNPDEGAVLMTRECFLEKGRTETEVL